MAIVLHLIPAPDWHQLDAGEAVSSDSLATDGFVHCTDDLDVLLLIANAFYAQQPGDFVVLHIDTEQLTSRCVWEEPAHVDGSTGASYAASFPHVYGPIDRRAVIGVQTVSRDQSGAFTGFGVLGPAN